MVSFLEHFREKRSLYLHQVGRFLLSKGITANMMTLLSLLSGVAAVYVLFSETVLFIIFAVIHLLADGVDGVIARIGMPTKFGKYFDYSTDRAITFLILIKIGWAVDSIAYAVAFLFLATNIVYVTSDFKAPVVFTRMILLIMLILQLPPTLAFMVAGVITVYSLAKQLQWYRKKEKK